MFQAINGLDGWFLLWRFDSHASSKWIGWTWWMDWSYFEGLIVPQEHNSCHAFILLKINSISSALFPTLVLGSFTLSGSTQWSHLERLKFQKGQSRQFPSRCSGHQSGRGKDEAQPKRRIYNPHKLLDHVTRSWSQGWHSHSIRHSSKLPPYLNKWQRIPVSHYCLVHN